MDYTTLLTAEHNQRPNFVALVGALTSAADAMTTVVLSMPSLFDVNVAVGQQLDIVGQWIGQSRTVFQVRLPFFGFANDHAALPFGELTNPSAGGRFWDLGTPYATATTMTDSDYRTVLKAKIVKNQYDGSLAQLETALEDIFGVPFSIADAGTLEIILTVSGTISPTDWALLTTLDLLPRPAGVLLTIISS